MRRTDYLLQRPGSQNWRVRLQEGGKSREQSLGTPDRALAEIRAALIIAQHKAKLLAQQGGCAFVLCSAEEESNPRKLFNLAHELGHVDTAYLY